MRSGKFNQAKEYLLINRQQRRWRRVAGLMACVAICCVAYLLMAPARTLEKETFCGSIEHTHGEECYEATIAESYMEMICGLQESEGHIHTDECYTEISDIKLQSSGNEEKPPVEEEEPPVEEEKPPIEEEKPPVVEEPPIEEEKPPVVEEPPIDVEPEVEIRKELTCGQKEIVTHTHEEGCFKLVEIPGEPALVCGLGEHTHSLNCYSNPNADLETVDDWEKTLVGVELTGDWQEDLIAVAETQLGYRESNANYIVLEDGETMKGYTRYGEWYGSPYGDWCAMYISFCLYYAGIEEMPKESGCENWILKLEEVGLYRKKEVYVPVRGDLVFFDNDEAENADHVAIVLEVIEATENQPAQIKTIEGNCGDAVSCMTYALDDKTIMGYGQLPKEPVPEDSCLKGLVENEVMTLELTQDSAAEEGVGLGDKHHRKDYLYYQISSHNLSGSTALAFMLVPSEYKNENNFTPYPKTWSASVDSNYVCAYCADILTYSSNVGADYVTYTIDDSRFTNQQVKDTLAGIVAHSYPFLTEEEMKRELATAYEAGEIKVDVTDCGPNEFLAAGQWAVWNTTTLSEDEKPTEAKGATISSLDSWNTLKDKGHTNNSTINSHVTAIRDWLISRGRNEKLQVADYIVDISHNPDGSYDLIVNAVLNRAITSSETAATYLEIDGLKSDETILDSGVQEFSLTLENLKDEDLSTAKVYFTVTGQHMQAYFYDSEEYQDLIGGKWENYSEDLSFNISTDITSVSVTKTWAETTRALDSVTVQLYANEKAYGNLATLSADDDWTYTWNNLLREDAWGNPITYTVRETPVDGYISNVEMITGTADTIDVWEKVEGELTENGQYLLVTQNGAIKEHVFKNANHYTYAKVDVTDASTTDNAMIWEFTANNGGFKIRNKFKRDYIGTNNSGLFVPQSSAVTMFFTDAGEMYYKSGSTKYYFSLLNTDGNATRTKDTNYAAKFTLYKLIEKDLPPSEINYVITNSKISENDVAYKTISVQKNWAGRSDGAYPSSATVTLLQNGQPYGDSVVLSEANNWSYQWGNMPVQIGEEEIVYDLKEISVEGYTTVIESTVDEHRIDYVVTNTKTSVEVEVELAKVDSQDNSKMLNNAKFDIYRLTHDGESSVTIPGTDGTQGILEQTEVTVGEDGMVKVTLEEGEIYYLVEINAPDGYYLLSEPVGFKVTANDMDYTVDILVNSEWVDKSNGTLPVVYIKNQMSYRLPETGGVTTTGCYAVGAALVMGVVLVFAGKKRYK